jgi:hypothetical protein
VFVDPPDEIVRHSKIQGAVLAAGEEIDVIGHHLILTNQSFRGGPQGRTRNPGTRTVDVKRRTRVLFPETMVFMGSGFAGCRPRPGMTT